MQNKIWEVIENFCVGLECFTSLDVSNAVKQGGFPGARHRDIAPVVRQLFADCELDSFGYMRTLIDVELLNGLKTKTNLYHHVSVSPDSYMNRKQVAIPPKADDVKDTVPVAVTPAVPTVASVPSFSFLDGNTTTTDQNNVTDDQADVDETEVECYCKTDGRLEIPVEWVRDMEWTSLDEVKFILENDKVIAFVGDLNDGETLIGKLTISSDNRVRVPKTVFMRAGFDYTAKAEHFVKKCDGYFEIEDSNV